jgi:hypothetical protein
VQKRTQLKRPTRDLAVIKARAGIIFESDDIADERLAEMRAKRRVFRYIRAYAKFSTYGSEAQAVIDILAYARQYCDHKGLAFHKLEAAAREAYLEEPVETV